MLASNVCIKPYHENTNNLLKTRDYQEDCKQQSRCYTASEYKVGLILVYGWHFKKGNGSYSISFYFQVFIYRYILLT